MLETRWPDDISRPGHRNCEVKSQIFLIHLRGVAQ